MQGLTFRTAKPEGAALILAIHHASILKLGLDGYSPEECASWAFGKKASDFVAAMEEQFGRKWQAQGRPRKKDAGNVKKGMELSASLFVA